MCSTSVYVVLEPKNNNVKVASTDDNGNLDQNKQLWGFCCYIYLGHVKYPNSSSVPDNCYLMSILPIPINTMIIEVVPVEIQQYILKGGKY